MSTYTSSLGLEKITPGTQAGLWGNTTNNTYDLIDQAITGIAQKSFAGASGTTWTLTDFNGAANEARSAVLNVTGTAVGANTIIIPNKQKTYFVRNGTGKDLVVQTTLGTTPCTVGAGYNLPVFCDGNNNVFLAILAPGAGTLTVSGGGTGVTTFGSGGFVKSSGGANALTSSATVSLTSEVSGTLPVSSGGTGVTSFTSGAVLLGNGTGGISTVTGGTAGYVLTWNGSNWAAAPSAAAGITTITAGVGISVSGTTNVTVTNTGVTSLSAGTGISLSATTGGITVTNTGPTLSGTNTWSGLNTFSNTVTATGANGYEASYGGYTGHLTGNSLQLGGGGIGLYWDGTQINVLASGGVAAFKAGGLFYVATEGYKPGGGSWAATSDARLKTGVAPLSGALDKICMLSPVTYDWKTKANEPTVGFIAQDVRLTMPTAVCETDPTEEQKQFIGDDKLLSISWKNDMMAYLVGAIKELKAEIDELKAAK